MMRRRNKSTPNPGDYVLATKYNDGDVADDWAVGRLCRILDYGDGEIRYDVVDMDGDSFRASGFRRAKKISHERGIWILNNKRITWSCGRSMWWWVRQRMTNATLR